MATRSPTPDGLAVAPVSAQELQAHRFWGRYATEVTLPNVGTVNGVAVAGANAAADPAFTKMSPGDKAYCTATASEYTLSAVGTVSGSDANWDRVVTPINLDAVINVGAADNDVNIPAANPIIFRDGGVALTPLSLFQTIAGATALSITTFGGGVFTFGAGQLLGPLGVLGTPTFAFGVEPNTGIRRLAAGQIGLDCLGVSLFTMSAGEAQLGTTFCPFTAASFDLGLVNRQWRRLYVNAGTVALPSIAVSDVTANTGLYQPAVNQLGLCANSEAVIVDNDAAQASFRPDVTNTWDLGEAAIMWRNIYLAGDAEIDGALNHDGTTVGFYGVVPTVRSAAYAITNVTPDRAYDADAMTLDEIADTLGTLIADLQLTGIIG